MRMTNHAETLPHHEDRRLRTRLYATALDRVEGALANLLPALHTYGRAWRISRVDHDAGRVTFKVEVPVVLFTDDLIIEAVTEGAHVRVDVRSRSRVGKGDFGENRRHVLQLLEALDGRLGGPTAS